MPAYVEGTYAEEDGIDTYLSRHPIAFYGSNIIQVKEAGKGRILVHFLNDYVRIGEL